MRDIFGTTNNDTIIGTREAERVFGLGAQDLIIGNGGNDDLRGMDGNDTVRGSIDDDIVRGGTGQDVLAGNTGNDVLRGGGGDDKLRGGDGDDKLFGGSGADVFRFSGNSFGHDRLRDLSLNGPESGGENDSFIVSGYGRVTDADTFAQLAEQLNSDDDQGTSARHIGDDVILEFGDQGSIRIDDGGQWWS